jgi:hypothetical protein
VDVEVWPIEDNQMNSPTRLIKQIVYFVFLAAFVLRAPKHPGRQLPGDLQKRGV